MSENTNYLTRRNALKGIAAFTGTSAVGAGAIIHGSEPAAAVDHVIEVDDITIETADGELEEFGISDLWFEATWENIPIELRCDLSIGLSGFAKSTAGPLGVDGDGTGTFGYGNLYGDQVNLDLMTIPQLAVPLTITDQEHLEAFSLEDSEDENTVEDVEFTVELRHDLDPGSEAIGSATAEFDVTVERIQSDGEVDGGEAGAFGED